MDKFFDSQMYFETKRTSTKKIFTIKFPYDSLLTMRWDEDELIRLKSYDSSSLVSNKLKMLAMIAEKLEAKNGEEDEQE